MIANSTFCSNSSLSNSTSHTGNCTSDAVAPKPDALVVGIRAFTTVIGVIGNVNLLTAAAKDRHIRAGTRLLVLNIAAISLLISGTAQPISIAYMYTSPPDSCPFTIYATLLVLAVKWSDVALSINRMVAVCYPHQYSWISSQKIGCVICGSIWSFAAAVVGMMGSGLGSHFQETPKKYCMNFVTNGLGIFLNLLIIHIPVGIFGCIAVYVSVSLVKNRSGGSNGQRSQDKQKALACAMIASFVWSFAATVPGASIYTFFPRFLASYPGWIEFLRLLNNAEYSVNPIIFWFFTRTFWRWSACTHAARPAQSASNSGTNPTTSKSAASHESNAIPLHSIEEPTASPHAKP